MQLRRHSNQLRKFFAIVQIKKKTSFFGYAILRCCKRGNKNLRKLTEHSELNNFTNMVAKIDIDALKISEQMMLKIGEKLRTASLNSKVTGSHKKFFFLTKIR